MKDHFPAGYKKSTIYLAILAGLLTFGVFIGALAFTVVAAGGIYGA